MIVFLNKTNHSIMTFREQNYYLIQGGKSRLSGCSLVSSSLALSSSKTGNDEAFGPQNNDLTFPEDMVSFHPPIRLMICDTASTLPAEIIVKSYPCARQRCVDVASGVSFKSFPNDPFYASSNAIASPPSVPHLARATTERLLTPPGARKDWILGRIARSELRIVNYK
ncbi:hypothetical protein BC830DRAFT_1144367 [Chytriomyces sp. MP71]|nr:hypothetical protein BC830DRAFT_1144367 [Chytriomyces sp. MP71]